MPSGYGLTQTVEGLLRQRGHRAVWIVRDDEFECLACSIGFAESVERQSSLVGGFWHHISIRIVQEHLFEGRDRLLKLTIGVMGLSDVELGVVGQLRAGKRLEIRFGILR